MAKFITRSYTDPKTGKIIKKNFRVDDNYQLREKGGYDEARKQNYTEEIQEQPGIGKTVARAALPSVVGTGLGALSQATQGGAQAGKAASAIGGTALASAANAFANYQNRVNPKSKAAAVGSGALSTAANAFAEANQRNIARGASAGQSALSGLGAGVEGALKGGLSMLPGGASLGEAASPLLGGIIGAIKGGNPAALLSGLAGAAGSVLRSKTLGQDMPQWFRKSEAKDYAGGTWGQGSGIEDLSDDEQAASNEAYLTENQPSVRSDMPTAFEGTAKDWMSDENADTRQDVQEQNQMDTYNTASQDALEKGGTEAEASQAGVEAQRYANQPAVSLDDIDEMTGGQFKTPQQNAGGDQEGADQTQQEGETNQGDSAEEVTAGTSNAENADADERLSQQGLVSGSQLQQQGEAGAAAPAVAAQGVGVVQQPQQPPQVQAAQNLPMPNAARGKVPPPPPPPAAPQPVPTQSSFATGFSSPVAKIDSEARKASREIREREAAARSQLNDQAAAPQPEMAAPDAQDDISLFGAEPEAAPAPEAAPEAAAAAAPPRAAVPAPAPDAAAAPAPPRAAAPAPAFSGLQRPEREGEQYKWGSGEVPSFFPIEDLRDKDTEVALMPNYEGKSHDEIEAENQRLMAEQEEYLKNASEQGSTNYYNENPDRYQFLDGFGYKQEQAAKLVPQTVFAVQGDADYEAPSEEDSITDNEGRIFIRTPLGMLQVGDKSGKDLPQEYRRAVQRIASNLSLNEGEPSEDYIKDAQDLYNQLPADVKGFSETPSTQRRDEALRNARMSLSGQMSPKSLKEEMTKLTDNAKRWNLRAKDLDKLRQIYKSRKKQLIESKYGKRRKTDDWALKQVGLESEGERQERKEAGIARARRRAEKGKTSEGLTNRQKIEYLRQQEMADLNRELPYRDRLRRQYADLEEEAKHAPEMHRGTPEALRRDAEMRRLQSLMGRIKHI